MSQLKLKNGIDFLRYLSGLGRQIVSLWRAKLFFQRAHSFIDDETVKKQLEALNSHGLITAIKKGRAPLWQANTPYLAQLNNIYELVNEAYPIASLGYSTALEIHHLTDQRFTTIHLFRPRHPMSRLPQASGDMMGHIVPPDTQLNDWQINETPTHAKLTKGWDRYRIFSHQTKNQWIFGTEIKEVEGVNVRISSIEKTLIDGLKEPSYCGGLDEVFKAWVRGLGEVDINQIVAYTKRYDRSILYQRVGYVCETLGLSHDRFSGWKQHNAPRGGSRLLNPHGEFQSTYDPAWNLSINHPVSILENQDADYS